MPKNEELIRAIKKLKRAKKILLKAQLREEGLERYGDKLDELLEVILANPEVDSMEVIIEKYERAVIERNPLYPTELAEQKALKNTYKGLYELYKGMKESALDVVIARQLRADIHAWIASYEALTIPTIKEVIERLAHLLEVALDDLPAIIRKAEDFQAKLAGEALDLATISVEDLVTGLQRFNADADPDTGAEYLANLQAEHAHGGARAITTFSAAAGFLFADVGGVTDKVEKFQLAKKITADYPSNTIGIYYRGDKRYPAKLNFGGKGFAAFEPLSLADARARAKAWFGAADAKSPGTYHEEHIRANLSEYISLGNDIGCMGYGCIGVQGANRNVYQIIVDGLREVEATVDSLGEAPHAMQEPTLIMDADTVDNATVIAVKGAVAGETTFFTGIESGVRMIYEFPNKTDGIEGGWVEDPQEL